ncbi:S1 family peptidase [Methylobacterium flocculans]|uniref:S1 family peptidase n=1 Tax=Methylobacterium flocculans TaxID=2984843 RepID=UPI0021F33447|nr:serine protease [Methylobacterium sp. FF17]
MKHPSGIRPIYDFVLPVCNLKFENEVALESSSYLAGTSFLIGKRGFGITAAHVITQTNENERFVIVNHDGKEYAVPIGDVEAHPTEDIAIFKLDDLPDERVSYIKIENTEEHPPCDYIMWGYPEIISEEVQNMQLEDHFLKFRPDIVCFKGYVRRKIDFSPNPNLSMYQGEWFFEVSDIGGSCVSGSPLFKYGDQSRVMGVYIAESSSGRKCGYATVLESLADWSPVLLGTTIGAEAASTSEL